LHTIIMASKKRNVIHLANTFMLITKIRGNNYK